MSNIIDLASITWNGEEVKSFNEAVKELTFAKPDLTEFHTVQTGIVAKKQIVFLGLLKKVTKKDAGCSSTPTNGEISASQKFWDPETVKVYLSECYSNLEGNFMVYAKKLGLDQADLTGTEWASFLAERTSDGMLEDAFRIVWFNDKDAANVDDSPAGAITSGVDVDDYNIIDGLWKQIFDIVAADSSRKVAISENSGVSKTAQDALATDRAYLVYNALLTKADYRLRTQPDQIIISTQSLLDNYINYLESKSVVFTLENIVNGIQRVAYRGIVIYGFNFWDRTIRADFDNGTTWDLPHRALYTTKSNLVVGVDSADMSFKQWFEMKDETTNLRGMYKIDAKVMEDYLIQAAY